MSSPTESLDCNLVLLFHREGKWGTVRTRIFSVGRAPPEEPCVSCPVGPVEVGVDLFPPTLKSSPGPQKFPGNIFTLSL